MEHRLVMEKILGRPLYPFETIHHKNGRRADNRPDNLELKASHHGVGQDPKELAAWLVRYYRAEVEAALAGVAAAA